MPEFHDYELAIGPVLDELEPDLIHAHDVHVLGICERAVARNGARGRRVALVYDAHEYVAGLSRYSPEKLAALVAVEEEYIHRADRVITVSEPLADLLVRDYRLATRPALVLNIPLGRDPDVAGSDVSIRRAVGLPTNTPLLVYSGGMDETRGVHTLVAALEHLPDVHVALVAARESHYTRALEETAESLGVSDRLHFAPFVAPSQVVDYLSTADVGVHTLIAGWLNHEIALPNKVFEYLHAGLPMVVSDCAAMKQFVESSGVGVAFTSEDPRSLAVAVEQVLADHAGHVERVREAAATHRWSWEAQQRSMLDVYRDLLGDLGGQPEEIGRQDLIVHEDRAEDAVAGGGAVGRRQSVARLTIGPSNMAGQGTEWARALRATAPGLDVDVIALHRKHGLNFPADAVVQPEQWRNIDWQLDQAREILTQRTHVLMEAGRGILGRLNGGLFDGDLPALERAGVEAAVVFHGSEVRPPDRHAELEEHSPFHEEHDGLTDALRVRSADLLARIGRLDVRRFVTTLDLMDYVPKAVWLPVAVDMEAWVADRRVLSGARPRVGHIPSSSVLKGSDVVDDVCGELHDRGMIEYVRLHGVPYADMPTVVRGLDVLVDGLVLGDYGVTACQAMAAGCLVLGNVGDRVRGRLPRGLPLVHVTPKTLGERLEELLDAPSVFAERAAEGPEFVRELHDGSMSARVLLEDFLEVLPQDV